MFEKLEHKIVASIIAFGLLSGLMCVWPNTADMNLPARIIVTFIGADFFMAAAVLVIGAAAMIIRFTIHGVRGFLSEVTYKNEQ